MEELPEKLRAKLYDQNGRFPACLFNLYELMLFYENEFGTVAVDRVGAVVTVKTGTIFRVLGKRIDGTHCSEFSRIKYHAYFLIGAEPSKDTIKRVLHMLAEDFVLGQANRAHARDFVF